MATLLENAVEQDQSVATQDTLLKSAIEDPNMTLTDDVGVLRTSRRNEHDLFAFMEDAVRPKFTAQDFSGVTKLIIHATDTPDDWEDDKTLRSVHDWHVNKKKWSAIGYHYLIGRDGEVYQTRNVTEQGAHAKVKDSNVNSLGIAFMGTGKNPTPQQLQAFAKLANGLEERLPNVQRIRHKDIDINKTDVPFDIQGL